MGLHKDLMDQLYKLPNDNGKMIDRWTAHFVKDNFDVLISDQRHLDKKRISKENEIWERIIKEGHVVVEIGCGAGHFLARLYELFGKSVELHGIDVSDTIIREASKRNQFVNFHVEPAEHTSFAPESVDVVLTISFYEHIIGHVEIIREISRILKPGGYLYICIHKNFIDPFVLPSVLKKAAKMLRYFGRYGQPAVEDEVSIYIQRNLLPLAETRKAVKEELGKNNFLLVKKDYLLAQFEWSVYKRISSALTAKLIHLPKFLNRLPFSYYKDLEYWLYQKPVKQSDCLENNIC